MMMTFVYWYYMKGIVVMRKCQKVVTATKEVGEQSSAPDGLINCFAAFKSLPSKILLDSDR
jgi:hypothetical protein